jgi:hypothetical protein
VTATNTGDTPLALQSVSLTGPGAASFVITAGDGSGTLAPGESRTISVQFAPTGPGAVRVFTKPAEWQGGHLAQGAP